MPRRSVSSLLCRRLLCSCLVVLLVFQCLQECSSASISLRALEPRRPDKFKSVEELREYLKQLHEYYSVVGRPRFGRSVEIPFLEDALREPSVVIPYRHFFSSSGIPYKRVATSDLLSENLSDDLY